MRKRPRHLIHMFRLNFDNKSRLKHLEQSLASQGNASITCNYAGDALYPDQGRAPAASNSFGFNLLGKTCLDSTSKRTTKKERLTDPPMCSKPQTSHPLAPG